MTQSSVGGRRRALLGPTPVDRAVRPARAQARAALPPVGGGAGRPDPGRLARAPQDRRPLAPGDGVRVLLVRRADDPRRAAPVLQGRDADRAAPRGLIELSRLVESE